VAVNDLEARPGGHDTPRLAIAANLGEKIGPVTAGAGQQAVGRPFPGRRDAVFRGTNSQIWMENEADWQRVGGIGRRRRERPGRGRRTEDRRRRNDGQPRKGRGAFALGHDKNQLVAEPGKRPGDSVAGRAQAAADQGGKLPPEHEDPHAHHPSLHRGYIWQIVGKK